MNTRDNNNFDAMRFFASTLVLFSHCFSLVLEAKSEPLFIITRNGLSGGRIAVLIFFVLSGFLIAASWDSKKDLHKFLVARIKRIFPGLALALLVTVIAGLFLTTESLTDYYKSAYVYFFKNLTLYKEQFDIVGIFESNPYGPAINGSLWTLRHEFTCYIIIALIGYFGLLRHIGVWLLWICCAALSLSSIIAVNFFQEFFPLCGWFLAGTLAYLHKDLALNRAGLPIAIILVVITVVIGLNLLIVSPVIAYFLIRLSYSPSVFSNFGKYGDFSYGVYIYAFPVQQFVIYLITKSIIGPMTWWVVFLVSFPITLLLAVASWHLIEKRFLKRRVVVP